MKTKKLHYAWVICACCTLVMVCNSGLIVSGFPVYTPYIMSHNGFTNVQVSMLTTLRSLSGVLAKLAVALFYAKISLRWGVTLSAFLTAGGFALYAAGTGIPAVYYAAAVLTGLGNGLGAMIPVSILINGWFRSRRTLALSICASGTAIASFLCPSVATWAIERWDLPTAFAGEAVFIALCGVLVFLLVRNKPQELGMEIYDTGEDTGTHKSAVRGSEPAPFYRLMMLLACFLVGGLTLAFPNSNTLYYNEVGFTSGQIALVLTFSGITLLLGKWIYGFLSDLLGSYRSNGIFILAIILGAVLGCMLNKDRLVLLILANSLLTIGFALATVGISVWASNLSDEAGYVRTLRNYQLSYTLGGLIFSSFPGILADLTGSYYPTRLISVAMGAVIFFAVQGAYRNASRR